MSVKNTSFRKMFRLLAFAALLVGGCVGAPVQEMSDARQAIQAARDAGAADYSPAILTEAQALMEQAQKQLELGEYGTARDTALSAKRKAFNARKRALENKVRDTQ